MKIKKLLIDPLLLGLASLIWCVKESTQTEKKITPDELPEPILCYASAYVPSAVEDVNQSLELLEKQYKEGKIWKKHIVR